MKNQLQGIVLILFAGMLMLFAGMLMLYAPLSLAPHPRQSPLRSYQLCGTGFRHCGTGTVFQKGKLTGFNSHFQSVFVPQTADFCQTPAV